MKTISTRSLKIIVGLSVAAVAIAGITFGLLAAFGTEQFRDPESITRAEATEILDKAYLASLQQDFETLCSLGGSKLSCQSEWRNNGEWTAVPEDSPVVIGSRVLPDVPRDGGSVSRGGRLLEVEGVDGLGRSFSTDFLVFDEGGGRLVALNPVYWTGINIVQLPANGGFHARPVSTPQ